MPSFQPTPDMVKLCEPEEDAKDWNWDKSEIRHGRGPYASNGVPIANGPLKDCCASAPCYCRSDVIFYDGVAYDQKPFIAGRLRIRPGNVMFFEGKMVPPFGPGKSPLKYGPQFRPDKHPMSICYNDNAWGRGRHQCCTSANSWDQGMPFEQSAHVLAYTDMGLPHGNTIGYFRFKPDRDCYERGANPILRYEHCCNCDEPGRYDASHYIQDECPRMPCC